MPRLAAGWRLRRLLLAVLAVAVALAGCAGAEIPMPATATPLPIRVPATAMPSEAAATTLAPTATPAGTEPPASVTPAPTALAGFYTVVAGDTFWSIAERLGISLALLEDANPSLDPNHLRPGDVLVIPDPHDPPPTRAPTRAPTAEAVGLPDLNNLTGLDAHTREIFAQGQRQGNRADVFSKVGDSITNSPAFLIPIGQGGYNLHDYAQLQGVIDYYSRSLARGSDNSFANIPLAAKVGWRASGVLDPNLADPAACLAGETPLACEYRLVQPAVALIMLGTNDVPSSRDATYEANLRQVIELTLAHGIVPVLSTIPPLFRAGLDGRSEEINLIIVRLAHEYDIPLWDYWAALQASPNSGIAADGVHPSWAPAGHNADFAPEYLRYGMVVRNLSALFVLDRIWREVLQP